MRNPEFEIGTNTTVTVYTGMWKWNNGVQIANQTGGTLYYKGATQSTWSTNGLTWLTNTTANQYWQASFNTANFGANEVIQYYFLLTFDGSNGVTNTYLYGGDGVYSTTVPANVGRREPVHHPQPARVAVPRQQPRRHGQCRCQPIRPSASGSRSVTSARTAARSRWADNACIYYTTDGSTPAGALGVRQRHARRSCRSAYDHEQDNPASPATPCGGWAR